MFGRLNQGKKRGTKVSTNPSESKYMGKRILKENPGRRIEKIPTSRWGRLVEPAPEETKKRPGKGLRILAVGSWTLGLLAFEGILSMEKKLPGKVQVVGLTTDDPHDPDAKISIHRRFWRYYDQVHREDYEWVILHRALSLGIPSFTGEVKCDGFRALLKKWNPDVIITAGFGQVIDETIINHAAFGIYHVHPSDLLHNYGAGPQPWEDIIQRKATSTRVTLHKMNTTIDDGDIVGQSPIINLVTTDGKTSDNVRLIGEKALIPVKFMVEGLIRTLVLRKESNQTGFLDSLDFEPLFKDELRKKLKAPLDPSAHGDILPLPEDEKKFTV